MSSFRSTLFNIEPGEAPAVVLSLLQSVFIGLPRLFSLSVGGALFLSTFPADDLPYAYIAASILLPLVGFLQIELSQRLSFVRLQLGTLLFLAAVAAAFLVLLSVSDARWPAFALFIWYAAEFQLSNLVLWNTANRMFTVREGKRLFGLIGTGEILAAVIGGALTPFLISVLGTVNLLYLSIIGFLLAFLNLGLMRRTCPQRFASEPGEHSASRSRGRESFAALFRSRFLALVFLTYALFIATNYFVSNILYFQLGEAFSTAAEVASFLGLFVAASSLLSLLFRTFLSGRVLVRFGLLVGLLASPVVVLAAAICVVGFGRWGAGVSLVFWGVVAMRLLERLFMGAFGQPAYYTLYQPLSRERRARVLTTAETIVGPIAGGVTGLVLLYLNKDLGLGSIGLSAAVLPVLGAWMFLSVAVGREYRTALTMALRRRGIAGGDLRVSDPISLQLLERSLESPRPMEVLYCLRLLEEAEHPRFRELLLGLIDHASPDVRRGVYQMIENNADEASFDLLAARLEMEEDGQASGALLRAVGAAGGAAARSVIEARRDNSDPAARIGAMVAMIRYCGDEAREIAARDLEEMAHDRDVGSRVFAAKVLADLGTEGFPEVHRRLMVDQKLEVRRTALTALRFTDDLELWSMAVDSLGSQTTRAEALRTFLGAGVRAFPALEQAFHSQQSSRPLRRMILQIFGRSGAPEAMTFLKGRLGLADRGLLSELLWSLHLCGCQASGADRHLVEEGLRHEVAHATEVIAASSDLAHEPSVELLTAALDQELKRARNRIFLLLSFLYDTETLMKIWANFGGSRTLRDLALELFEERVDKKHAALTMPVLAGQVGAESLGSRERARQIVFNPTFWTGAWTRACAVDALAGSEGALAAEEWALLESDSEELTRETAAFLSERRADSLDGRSDLDERLLPTIERVRVLAGVSIFKEIDDEVLAELAQSLEEVRVEAGETVFREGDIGQSMYIVTDGCLRLHSNGETLSELRSGEIFGELSALEAEARTESATAVVASHLFRLSDAALHAFMATRIEVVRGIIEVLCHRVRVAPTEKLADKEEKEREVAGADPVSLSYYRDDYLSSLEKVLILKTAEIFAEVSDDILNEVAARTEEVRLKKNEVLFHKGDPGTTTYIVAAGRIRIHVGDRWIADAAERTVVGELAALSSEPRTASITAADDSLLLSLDQESLFELMWDQQEIVRGIIRVLVGRLRRLHELSSA